MVAIFRCDNISRNRVWVTVSKCHELYSSHVGIIMTSFYYFPFICGIVFTLNQSNQTGIGLSHFFRNHCQMLSYLLDIWSCTYIFCIELLFDIYFYLLGCEAWQVIGTDCLPNSWDLWIFDGRDKKENLFDSWERWPRLKSSRFLCQVRTYVHRNDLAEKFTQSTLPFHCIQIHAILEHAHLLVFHCN